MKTATTRIPAIVLTEVRSLRAAKAHTTRWLNRDRLVLEQTAGAIKTFNDLITKGDQSDMTWNSLAQARAVEHRQNVRIAMDLLEIKKIDDRIAELVEYGVQYEQRQAAEGGN